MIERIELENFKAARQLSVRLGPLTVLAGLNSAGKSSVLQAIAMLRQSYNRFGLADGLLLSGPLVSVGKFRDLRTEGAVTDSIAIAAMEDGEPSRWELTGTPGSSEPSFTASPQNAPRFVYDGDFQFLQADRFGPRTLYPQAPQRERDRDFLGCHGEFTANFLAREGTRPVSAERRRTPCGLVESGRLLARVAPTGALADQASGWLQELSPGVVVTSADISGTDETQMQFAFKGLTEGPGTNSFRPTNVGFGLSYSLPVIVACLATRQGGLILLENPEAHLHPQGQAAMGDLISRCAADGVQVIVETHSDHLINGIRIAVKKGHVDPSSVVLNFFTRAVETGEASVQSPKMLEGGRLSNWPKGFFDQWDKDLDSLLG